MDGVDDAYTFSSIHPNYGLAVIFRIYLEYFLCFSPISHDEFFTFSGGNSIVHER